MCGLLVALRLSRPDLFPKAWITKPAAAWMATSSALHFAQAVAPAAAPALAVVHAACVAVASAFALHAYSELRLSPSLCALRETNKALAAALGDSLTQEEK